MNEQQPPVSHSQNRSHGGDVSTAPAGSVHQTTPSSRLQSMGARQGSDSGDVQRLFSNGLTEATAQKAATLGIDLKDIWNWYSQFGPVFLTILTEILSRTKSPSPEPQPAPEPAEETK